MRNGNEEIRNGKGRNGSLTPQQFWHDLTVLLPNYTLSHVIELSDNGSSVGSSSELLDGFSSDFSVWALDYV